MKLYIAGSSAELPRARAAHDRCRAAGIELTSTWLESIEQASGVANPRDASRQIRAGYARSCKRGVQTADALWLLAPLTATTIGAWWECGIADEREMTMFASGDTRRTIFTAHCEHEFETDDEAFAAIVAFAKQVDSMRAMSSPGIVVI